MATARPAQGDPSDASPAGDEGAPGAPAGKEARDAGAPLEPQPAKAGKRAKGAKSPKSAKSAKAAGPVPQAEPTEDERRWAFAAHLGALLVGALAPLVTQSMKKDSPFVQAHSRESLNFQLTAHLVEAVGLVLTVVDVGACIFIAAWGVSVIFAVLGGAKAWNGAPWRYPVSIRFLKS